MAYTLLSDEERCRIWELKVKRPDVRSVAEHLGRDKNTIDRDLRRGRKERGYRPAQAARMAHEELHTFGVANKTIYFEGGQSALGLKEQP